MRKTEEKNKNDYKVIIAELRSNPFQIIKIAFALMCIIPLLVMCYIILGKNFLYNLFLGNSGIEAAIAIIVAFTGLLYAYNIVRVMIEKLLRYADERRLADNEKTEVLLSLGRDLKAPVEMLKLGITDLAGYAGKSPDGANAEKRKACLNAAETISKFVNEMADFERTGFIRMNVKRALIDLRDIVKAGLNSAMDVAQKNKIELQYAFATNNAKLWGDEKKLSKAAMGLLFNVMKYTPRGGSIDVTVSSNADTVQFSVINKGAGFSSDEITRMLEKREKPDKDPEALEFSVIKEIVDLHNGHISVNSEPGKATAFSMVLPRDLRMKRGVRGESQQLKQGALSAGLPYADGGIRMAGAINKMLKDLIYLSRTEGMKIESKREHLDMAPLVNDAILSYEREISEKRLILKEDIPQDIGSLWADRRKLSAAIVILLSNAVKHAPSGGSIVIKLEGAEDEIRFEISDTGAGIEKEDFERLACADGQDGPLHGLAMVKHILELHKGKIWMEGEVGKAGKFVFTLPRDPRIVPRAS